MVDVKIGVGKQFTNEYEFVVREHILERIRIEAAKLGFNVVIGRPNYGSNRRQTFVTLRCKRNDKYTKPIRKLKHDGTNSRKCECHFKLCGYLMVNNTWTFNVICGIHNHGMCYKLVDQSIACCINLKGKELVYGMTSNMGSPKHTCNCEIEKASKCLKYQTCIQCPCPKQQDSKRFKN
ncbi:uncharacterized protein LOC127093722 [Lathyrus oleraceus]|uniref:uncharacterized protein LOC127093722 n=1 Tax=Pisum sativum TaxID=3888 RepID=UPI0021D28443|nr:uncharacterized protein LOC127093722 [Pisum sativum]